MTLQELLVVRVMLAEPAREMYGLEIRKAVGLPSGTLHPILARLERRGLLESRWEEVALEKAHISAAEASPVAEPAAKRIPGPAGGV
jgi:hypothetical protein